VGSIFVWWLLITIFSIGALPITIKVFQFLPDRGYGFSKPLGLVLVGLLAWLIGFLHFSELTILLAITFVFGFSFLLLMKFKDEIIDALAERKRYILIIELFFIFIFILFAFFRMYNPDISGSEKFMDMAFLNALSRAHLMPPYDPWMSGDYTISYYYFGYFLMAMFLKLSHSAPAVGFNLSLAMLFALSGIGVFTLLYNLTRRLMYAFSGWAAIFMLGNLDGFKQLFSIQSIWDFNWWTPSRVVPYTINEFPFFSFLLGDMHPHMLAVPFIMVGLGMGLNHLLTTAHDISIKAPDQLARFSLWGLVIGSLGFINSWDLPSGLFIAMLSIFLQQYRQRIDWKKYPWKDMGLVLAVIMGFMVIPYLPFYFNFHSQAKGIAWTTQNTLPGDFLLIFGLFTFMVLTFVIARYHAWFVAILSISYNASAQTSAPVKMLCSRCESHVHDEKHISGKCGQRTAILCTSSETTDLLTQPASQLPTWILAFFMFFLQPITAVKNGTGRLPAGISLGVLGMLVLAVTLKIIFFDSASNPQPVLLAVSLLFIASIYFLLAANNDKPETVFVLVLLLTAGLLVFGCEFLHVKDAFNPPFDRMNTVFKFFYITWYLLGIAGVYGVYWLFNNSMYHAKLKAAWLLPLLPLIAASVVYPYAAVMIKSNHFSNQPTLDGSAYLRNSYPADRAGIEWLRNNAQGNPVVLEATGGQYTDFARVSTFSGLPTLLGWGGHELQWRGNYEEPSKRIPDIDTLYGSGDIELTRTLIEKYNITFVFVGTLERQKYAAKYLEKFDYFMETVFKHPGGVTIYRRK
jgi:uncharacterized membrane protein